MATDYYGKCGSCEYCELGDSFKWWAGSMKFRCTKYGSYVKADEDHCGKYSPARGRSNSDIAAYDR